jgi:hypothetical protein
MPPRLKKSATRSEMRTVRDKEGHNYLIIRFWDDKNSNWEYHVYAEVIAKEAVRDIGNIFGYRFPIKTNPNVRALWDKIWNENLIY